MSVTPLGPRGSHPTHLEAFLSFVTVADGGRVWPSPPPCSSRFCGRERKSHNISHVIAVCASPHPPRDGK